MIIKEDSANVKRFESEGEKLLEQVGLKERITHKPKQLSGGEQQRVSIARALVNKPKIIFCDEPTGNLDSESGQGIISLLKNLNQENNITLIIVTHDEKISQLTDRTIHLKDGVLV